MQLGCRQGLRPNPRPGWPARSLKEILLRNTALLFALLAVVIVDCAKRVRLLCSRPLLAVRALEIRATALIDRVVAGLFGSGRLA